MKKQCLVLLVCLFVSANNTFASEAGVQESVSPATIPDRLVDLLKRLQKVNNELGLLEIKVTKTDFHKRLMKDLNEEKWNLQKEISSLREKLNNEALYTSILDKLK